jgi:LytR cell envelope-related transcriptional attenuator
VDHPLRSPDVLVRPWRLAAFVAASIAAIELLLLLAIGGGWLVDTVASSVQRAAHEAALAPKKASAAKPAAKKNREKPKPAAEILPRGKTVVMVLNGNGRTGAAAAAASRVRGKGYRVGTVGNAGSTSFRQDLVMFRPGFAEEGRRLARALGVRRVGPLDGMRVRQLGRAHAVLILGD